MCPYHLSFLVTRSEAKACAWQDQLYYSMRKPMHTGFRAKLNDLVDVNCTIVVFGRSSVIKRWRVIFSGKFHRGRTSRREFNLAMKGTEQAESATHWFIVWCLEIYAPRQVVSVFNRRWMVFDQYGKYHMEDPCMLSVMVSREEERVLYCPPSTSLAGSVDGPVPNTTYVDKDAKVISEGDDIELTPDALNYYEIADEAHADPRSPCEGQR